MKFRAFSQGNTTLLHPISFNRMSFKALETSLRFINLAKVTDLGRYFTN